MSLIDTYGRKINYLRLSVTDRCNLRCSYCMPSGPSCSNGRAALNDGDILRIARAAIASGVEKIRVTGGEPLVRPGIVALLAEMKGLPGLKNIVLTTNGIFLHEKASQLRAAGVESLNISIDSLRSETFRRITRGGYLGKVLEGIESAEAAGFPHIKLNVVVMRGINDDEIEDFAALTLDKPYKVRFIEHMPLSPTGDSRALTVPGREVLERIARRFSMKKMTRKELDGPAEYYRLNGAIGEVGVITPISCHFCGHCNRLRVTSDGVLKSCLFDDGVISLCPFLELGDDAGLREAFRCAARVKPFQHSLLETRPSFTMAQIGG